MARFLSVLVVIPPHPYPLPMSHKKSQWILAETPEIPPDVDTSIPGILTKMMCQRGIKITEMKRFLQPRLQDLQNPFLMPDMEPAVNRILAAIEKDEHVCVYGDYEPEGYGLNDAALKRCMAEGTKPDLLITVDCGTASIEEIQALKDEGIDVIVVDHHEPSPHGKPDCIAIVNPKCSADSSGASFDYLCAAGVVFKLAHALLKTQMVDNFDLKEHLDLVALATVADIVPLVDENRLLVRHGLKFLANTKNEGLRALMDVAQVKGPLTSADVGFRIGPRINAAGRMDQPEDALATLTTTDPEEAVSLAKNLDRHNKNRQGEELRINKEALAKLEAECDPSDPVIVLGSRDWHPGVVGIVASRMMRRFHKPAFIIAIDKQGMGKGSGRSIGGVSLMDAINSNRYLLESGGGHAMAAGISIHEDKISAFRQGFSDFVTNNLSEDDLLPRLYIDAEIDFPELSLDFLNSYELLQPFGSANPEPLFMTREVWLTEPPQELKNHHLKLQMKQKECWKNAMFFGAGQRELPEQPWDIAFTINRNVFRGRTRISHECLPA